MDHKKNQSETARDWSSPKETRRIVRKLTWVLAILVGFEFFGLATGKIHHHEHFESIPFISGLDSYPGFFAFYGFTVFAVLLWVATKFIGHVLQRREDYYQSQDAASNSPESESDR